MLLVRCLLVAMCLGISLSQCPSGPDGKIDCKTPVLLDEGDYQHCYSCKLYIHCDGTSDGMTVIPTPPDKYWDANYGLVWWSYTCTESPIPGPDPVPDPSQSTDWKDITCINFDQTPNAFYGSKGIYVKHTGVDLKPNSECGDPISAGQCGYFPDGRALLQIPYFKGNDFVKMSLSFWFKRSGDERATLINKYPEGLCATSALDVLTPNVDTLMVEVVDIHNDRILLTFPTVDQSDWMHVAITYDGSWDSSGTLTVKVYINGAFVDSNLQLKGRLRHASGAITVGVHVCHDDNYFHGYMDTISFSRKILSASQALDLSNDRSKCFV